MWKIWVIFWSVLNVNNIVLTHPLRFTAVIMVSIMKYHFDGYSVSNGVKTLLQLLDNNYVTINDDAWVYIKREQGQIYQSVKPCRSIFVVRWQHNQTVFVIILQNFFLNNICVFKQNSWYGNFNNKQWTFLKNTFGLFF